MGEPFEKKSGGEGPIEHPRTNSCFLPWALGAWHFFFFLQPGRGCSCTGQRGSLVFSNQNRSFWLIYELQNSWKLRLPGSPTQLLGSNDPCMHIAVKKKKKKTWLPRIQTSKTTSTLNSPMPTCDVISWLPTLGCIVDYRQHFGLGGSNFISVLAFQKHANVKSLRH